MKLNSGALQYAVHVLLNSETRMLSFSRWRPALDWALMLEDLAKSVTLVHRRERSQHMKYSAKVKNHVNVKTLNVTEN